MSADPIHYKSIIELSGLFRRGELLPSKVTEAMLDRIAKLDGKFHGYALVLAERAMAQAKRCDAELARGIWRGPLHGVPIGLKDLCYTSFAPTAGGTTIHARFVPSFNATIVDRLELAGAVTLGKLKMTEGAYTSHHPDDQAPLNPWGVDYWVGSSSSGSGVATSAGLCFGSIGSDTGGSIRFPSATCGLTGIKPTWGRVSRHGIFPLADSLDHVGPMARSVADVAIMLDAIAGRDPKDPTSLEAPAPQAFKSLTGGIRGVRIGLDRDYALQGIDSGQAAAIDRALQVLQGWATLTNGDLLAAAEAEGFDVLVTRQEPALSAEPDGQTPRRRGHRACAVARSRTSRRPGGGGNRPGCRWKLRGSRNTSGLTSGQPRGSGLRTLLGSPDWSRRYS